MRVIEQEMVNAIRDKKNWRKSNTQVTRNDTSADVYLFDKHIARVYDKDLPLARPVAINTVTLINWPTATTASRLNALLRKFSEGESVSVRKGGPFVNNVRVF